MSEILADAMKVIVHIVDPKPDPIWIARTDRVVGEADPQTIAEAEIGVGLRNRTAFAGIAVEQAFIGPALQNER